MGDKTAVLEGRGKTEVGDLVLDVTLNEKHNHTASTTDNPLEDGANAADHTIQKPDQLSLEGLWTDTPLDADRAELNRAVEMYRKLVRLKESGEAVTVVSGLRVYENMVIQKINSRKDPGTGYSVPVSVSLKESRFVTQQTEFVPLKELDPQVEHTAGETKQRGRQPSEQASEKTEQQSSELYDLFYGG